MARKLRCSCSDRHKNNDDCGHFVDRVKRGLGSIAEAVLDPKQAQARWPLCSSIDGERCLYGYWAIVKNN